MAAPSGSACLSKECDIAVAREISDISKKCKMKKGSSSHNNSPYKRNGIEGTEHTFRDGHFINSPEKAFKWLIHPECSKLFLRDVWEKKPMLVKRSNENYYNGLFSCSEFDKLLRTENLHFGRNLDITKYENGKRETLNADGRAYAPVVWDQYQTGCSVRLLNPQTYCNSLWKLNSTLQEFFGSFVGANVYLTPAQSQGFAPHYDDIEAFILQIEGRKKWKVYAPLTSEEQLPRFSSPNLNEEDMQKPILEVELFPGDLLYFPRGFIHQAKTTDEHHSLHITLSTYQKNCWGDFLEKLIPTVLETTLAKEVELRKGLPRDYLNFMGIANSDAASHERQNFKDHLRGLFEKMMNGITMETIDAVADQMGKRFLHDSMPLALKNCDKMKSIHGSGERWYCGRVINASELDPGTQVRLIKKYTTRLVMEDEHLRLYHCLENTRLYHEVEPQYVEIPEHLALGVECLLSAYPAFIQIEDLPLETLEEKMDVAALLYDKGLLMTKDILEVLDDED